VRRRTLDLPRFEPESGMQPFTLSRVVAVAFLAAAVLPAMVVAASPPAGEVSASASLSGIYQFDTDLDRGGDFRWAAGIASGSLTRQITPQFSAGLALRYDYEDWKFSRPAAFGGLAPWTHLNAPTLSADLGYAFDGDLQVGVSPLFGWAFESGAKAGDALTYGAIIAATKVFSPRLMLGAGVGVVRQIDETKAFPFVIVRWQINDRWRLGNPFPAGPAGGAGLELVYAPGDPWELAGGGAYRSTRYRLDAAGIAPGGVGENRFFPLFARMSRNFGAQTRVELYAGVALGGRLKLEDANGTTIARDDYSTAPLVGLTLSHRY
jgi:hypothetical protein